MLLCARRYEILHRNFHVFTRTLARDIRIYSGVTGQVGVDEGRSRGRRIGCEIRLSLGLELSTKHSRDGANCEK